MDIFILIDGNAPANPISYYKAVSAPTCSTPKKQICYIKAENNGGGLPIIDTGLLNEMIMAITNSAESSRVFLKS